MGYQKSKHVESAQKFLHQGKIPQAVAEYLIVLKHEPKDQVTLMTVGDLFVRQGETFQALEYFERLAQIYLADGFLTKAIAIYKKITKLAPEEMRPIERLADLYVQQGVMSEARPIYLQMAEMHQRANRPAQAVGLLRKLLDAEPDNPRVQLRLAELLTTMSQPAEAADVLRTAAQQLLRRGDHAEALRFIDRVLKIAPKDEAAITLRAKALIGAGKQGEAVAMLQSLADADAGVETSILLVNLYLDAGETARATELAERIYNRDPKRFSVVQDVTAALLDRNEADQALTSLQLIQTTVLDGGEHERFSELLARVAEAMPGRLEPLEALVALYGHTSDSFRLPDALIHLAEAYEAAGQIDLAVHTYSQFLDREPENDTVRRKRERLQFQGLPGATPAPTPAPAAEPVAGPPIDPTEVAEAPPARPAPEANLDQETQLFVSQALTDVDLYSSYGLAQKAVELLETILQRAPDYPPALERLLDMSVGLNDSARAVDLAAHLERIYTESGDRTAAERFSDLRRRFERASSTPETPRPDVAPPAAAPMAPAAPAAVDAVPTVVAQPFTPGAPPPTLEFAIPVVDAQPEPEPTDSADSAIVADSAVHEVDLSQEWAALSGLNAAPESDLAAEFLDSVAAPSPEPSLSEEPEEAAPAVEESIDVSAKIPEMPVVEAAPDPVVEDMLLEYERALDGPGAPAVADALPVANSVGSMDSFMRSISAELDDVLPAPAPLPPADNAVPAPKASAPEPRPKPPARSGPLGDIFDDFRAEMGESEKEDPEVHYNLGTAYREMGLMEEAISEFQKVASAHQHGEPFPYAMQCYTLLALAFVDKGQPSIAVSWYERALQVPGLDPETLLALRYDLGVSQEMAGDIDAAQKSFSQVYGMNIDYRDVAERLAALARTR